MLTFTYLPAHQLDPVEHHIRERGAAVSSRCWHTSLGTAGCRRSCWLCYSVSKKCRAAVTAARSRGSTSACAAPAHARNLAPSGVSVRVCCGRWLETSAAGNGLRCAAGRRHNSPQVRAEVPGLRRQRSCRGFFCRRPHLQGAGCTSACPEHSAESTQPSCRQCKKQSLCCLGDSEDPAHLLCKAARRLHSATLTAETASCSSLPVISEQRPIAHVPCTGVRARVGGARYRRAL